MKELTFKEVIANIKKEKYGRVNIQQLKLTMKAF